jgi:CTP:molybdopterin cytidylyltransferase MocA
MKENVAVIILAAGMGTRMKSDKAKVLHKITDQPMISYVVETARKIAGDLQEKLPEIVLLWSLDTRPRRFGSACPVSMN